MWRRCSIGIRQRNANGGARSARHIRCHSRHVATRRSAGASRFTSSRGGSLRDPRTHPRTAQMHLFLRRVHALLEALQAVHRSGRPLPRPLTHRPSPRPLAELATLYIHLGSTRQTCHDFFLRVFLLHDFDTFQHFAHIRIHTHTHTLVAPRGSCSLLPVQSCGPRD